ncbi:MAG: 30S ribosomal protein S17 [bacterium]|nr:30S ribosomal protein S17 [bacterium]MDE0240265.1 30S ribosomal protein S17 [bacterium]
MPRRTMQGVVTGKSGDKTVVVRVDRLMKHPLYKKTIRRSKRYHVHDETNDVQVGDKVRIGESRPLSKLKRWTVLEPAV